LSSDDQPTYPLPAVRASGRGRPSTYDPAFCDKVIEFGRMGKSRAWIAAELGVNRDTINEWEKVHPDFSVAMSHAKTLSQQWWEDAGQAGMMMPGFGATLWAKNVNCRFREDWGDKNDLTIKGDAANPLAVAGKMTVEFVRPDPIKTGGGDAT
jgi:DNA-binding XRE family transcriptional regulator